MKGKKIQGGSNIFLLRQTSFIWQTWLLNSRKCWKKRREKEKKKRREMEQKIVCCWFRTETC